MVVTNPAYEELGMNCEELFRCLTVGWGEGCECRI